MIALCRDFCGRRQEQAILVLKTVPAAVIDHGDNG